MAFQFIESANKYLSENVGTDIIGFVSNQVKPRVAPNFSIMNINEAFDFDGVVVATDLHAAEKVAKFPGPRRRYFYVWDLEWVGASKGWAFERLSEIYNSKNLTLLARHGDHAKAIEQCWNCRVAAVVKDCDISELVKIIDDKR